MKVKPATARLVIVLAVGALILGATAWRTYPRKPKRSLAEFSQYRYMHCKKCAYETMYSPDDEGKDCPQCGSDLGMIPTVESVKAKAGMSPFARMTAILFSELIVFMAAVWFVLRPRATDGEVAYRYMRCPHCTQKLRYHETQIGCLGACTRCKRALLFPEGSPGEKELDGIAGDEEAEEADEADEADED
jgi:hypothetical protein